jgi:hypothetical protein
MLDLAIGFTPEAAIDEPRSAANGVADGSCNSPGFHLLGPVSLDLEHQHLRMPANPSYA